MKFRNPETGGVFSNLFEARIAFCHGNCRGCPISLVNNDAEIWCDLYCRDHPQKAARLMGYEVIETEDELFGNSEQLCEPNMKEKCPICDYHIENCQCRFGGSAHPDWNKRRDVVKDHLYLFSDEQVKHIIELERYWKTSYLDEEKEEIRKELEAEYNPTLPPVKSKENNMNKQKKPRICEILGVDIGEKFYVGTIEYVLTEDGEMKWWYNESDNGDASATSIIHMINHPEYIVRAPKWSEQEIEVAKHIKLLHPDVIKL